MTAYTTSSPRELLDEINWLHAELHGAELEIKKLRQDLSHSRDMVNIADKLMLEYRRILMEKEEADD